MVVRPSHPIADFPRWDNVVAARMHLTRGAKHFESGEVMMRLDKSLSVASGGALLLATMAPAFVNPALADSIDDKTAQKQAEIPTCTHKLGTLAVQEPQNNWWRGLGLESPEALIKVFVMKSGCFTLLDRGAGFQAAQQERALASGGQLQQGSNVGLGQVKAADYVMVPDIVSKNNNSSGSNFGGLLGGF